MKKIFRHWKLIYAVCCIVYVGFVINAGSIEYQRINSQYRTLVKQLDPERIRSAALVELSEECRKELKSRADRQEIDCRTWPPALQEAKAREIEDRRLQAKQRGTIKLVLFYTFFILIFLLAPLVVIYLLIIGATRLYKSIKIVR